MNEISLPFFAPDRMQRQILSHVAAVPKVLIRPISFRTFDGLKLQGDIFELETPNPRLSTRVSLINELPDSARVLLLHGGGQTRHAWASTASFLTQTLRVSVVTVDQRGHGDSDHDPTGQYHGWKFAADASLLISQFSIPPLVVGFSLGGLASLEAQLGNTHPQSHVRDCFKHRAKALALVDIAPRLEPAGVQRILSWMNKYPSGFATLEEAADAVASYLSQRSRPENIEGLKKNLRKSNGRWIWHWDPALVNFWLQEYRNPDKPSSVMAHACQSLKNMEVLLVRGRLSDVLSEQGAKQFLTDVPHAKYVDVSDATHLVGGDTNDVFNEAVSSWIRNVLQNSTRSAL